MRACSGAEERQRSGIDVQLSEKKSLSVYARVEKKTTKESRSLTIQRRGGAGPTLRRRRRPERLEEGRAEVPECRPVLRDAANILREVAASKETRRRSEIKQTALRQSKDDDKERSSKRARTLPAIVRRKALDVRRSSKSGERCEDGRHLETHSAERR